MKLAITGKGGVGKTTLASLLCWSYALDGNEVIAVDANCDANLAGALGINPEEASKIKPISELKDLIDERTGIDSTKSTGFFKLNPKVDDIPEKYTYKLDRIKLLIMGTVKKGGSGCLCSESAFIKTLLSHLILKRSEVVIVDMDAGLENVGRGTAQAVDAFIVVVEPGQRSIQTAKAIQNLAKDIGIRKCYIVGSKTNNDQDREYITINLPGFDILGFINYSTEISEADRLGANVYKMSPDAQKDITLIRENLTHNSKNQRGQRD